MLGIEGFSVLLAYLLCIISAAICIVYGLSAWNKGEEPLKQEDIKWAEEERKDTA